MTFLLCSLFFCVKYLYNAKLHYSLWQLPLLKLILLVTLTRKRGQNSLYDNVELFNYMLVSFMKVFIVLLVTYSRYCVPINNSYDINMHYSALIKE